MKTKGFTLVELLVVIAILAILATVSVVGYTSFIDRANQSNSDTEAHQIAQAIESALIIPGEVYEIADDVYASKNADGKIVLSSDEKGEIALTDAVKAKIVLTTSEDFSGLKGYLKVADGKLVYVYDTDITTDVVAVVDPAAAANP